MKNLFSWKSLRKLGTAGLVIVGVNALASGLGVLPFVSTAFAVGLSAVATTLALVGVGVIGVAVAASAVKVLVNALRYVFSKKYRNQVKERRQARKLEKQQKREQKKNKNKTQNNVQEQTQEQEQTNNKNQGKRKRSGLFSWLKKRAKKNKNKTVSQEEVAPVGEETPAPVVEETKEPVVENKAVKKTTKAGGYYDAMTDDNKNVYDGIIKKNAKNIFEGLDRSQVQQMKELTNGHVKSFKTRIKQGEVLNEQEQMELARASALYIKANNILKKMDKIESEKSTLTEEQVSEVYKKVGAEKKSSGKR